MQRARADTSFGRPVALLRWRKTILCDIAKMKNEVTTLRLVIGIGNALGRGFLGAFFSASRPAAIADKEHDVGGLGPVPALSNRPTSNQLPPTQAFASMTANFQQVACRCLTVRRLEIARSERLHRTDNKRRHPLLI